MKDKIAESMGMNPLEEEIVEGELIEEDETNVPSVQNPREKQNEEDMSFVRSNLRELIDKGQDVLDDYIAIAGQGQSAREFEVVATLMKTVLDANKELVDYMKKSKDINEIPGDGKGQKNVTNNNLFVTTADLQRMLEDGSKNKDE